MQLIAFGVDQPDLLSADTCLVGCWEKNDVSNISDDKGYVIVTVNGQMAIGQQADSILCLQRRLDEKVQSGETVIPYWVLDLLGITNGSHVTVVPAMINFLDPASLHHIKLVYKAWKSYRHWDEVATGSKLCIPGTWSAGWPSGISVTTLIKFLPVLLDAKNLIDNSILVLDVLDMTMMFQVKLKTGGKPQQGKNSLESDVINVKDARKSCVSGGERNRAVLVVPILEKRFKIIVDTTTSSSQKREGGVVEEGNTDSQVGFIRKDSFLNETYSRIISICKAAFQLDEISMNENHFIRESMEGQHNQNLIKNKNKSPWNGVRSLLICAPEGAGKTFLLGEIEQSLRILRENPDLRSDSEFVILKLSAKNCGNQLKSEDRNVLRPYLYHVLQSMNTSQISPIIEGIMKSENPVKMVLLIDDLDILFLPFMRDDGEGDDQMNVNDKDVTSVRAAYLLRQLLSAIAVPEHRFDQIIVIGATRLPPSSLPRSHTGAPEFESALNLPRPSRADRVIVLEHLMGQSDLILEPLTHRPEPGSGVRNLEGEKKSPDVHLHPHGEEEIISCKSVGNRGGTDMKHIISSGADNTENDLDCQVTDTNSCPYELQTEIADNLAVWVGRIADLTAGYLPGDLSNIVRRAAGTFLGQKSFVIEKISKKEKLTSKQKNNERENHYNQYSDNNVKEKEIELFFSWKSMLLVIASLPPKQLQKLESFLNGVTSEGSDLSWADYCGYEEIKIKLKRLLRSTKNEILPKENQYKPKTGNFDSDSSTNITQHPDSSDKYNVENSDDAKRSDMLLKNSTDNTTEENKFQTSSRSLSTLNQDQQQKQNQNQKQKIKFQSMHGRVRGIVIHGPSGCGKSFLAKIFAAEAKMNFVSVRSSDLLSKYFGQTEASIRMLFKRVRAAAPCVLFFDEFDTLAYKRGTDEGPSGGGGTGLQTRVLSTFLNELDGITSQDLGEEGGIIVLAACTDITVLDDALLRPGRLEHHIRLDLPNKSDIKEILAGRLMKLTCSDDVCVDDLADVLTSKLDFRVTGADIDSVCRRAMMSRIREHLSRKGGSLNDTESEKKHIKIGNKNFLEALEECYPSGADCVLLSEGKEEGKGKSEDMPFEWTGSFSGGMTINTG